MNPSDLQYTREHEWVRRTGGDVVRFGITDFAQDALGDIVYVSLPAVGQAVTAGQPCGEVESTKSVSEVFAPLTGTVIARNEALDEDPAAINSDPYGAGWLAEVSVSDDAPELLDAAGYDEYIASL